MAAKAICDGCGKEQPMIAVNGRWVKPRDWYERSDEEGTQTACSRKCVDKIAEKSGKTSVILPL